MTEEQVTELAVPKSQIRPGILAYVRTCGEPVFVLEVRALQGPNDAEGWGTVSLPSFSGLEALVRVPKLTDTGIRHVMERFLVEELESKEDKLNQQFEDLIGIASKKPSPPEKPSLN